MLFWRGLRTDEAKLARIFRARCTNESVLRQEILDTEVTKRLQLLDAHGILFKSIQNPDSLSANVLSFAVQALGTGILGRPGRHFQRQNRRQPARCHRINVFTCTTTSASRQSRT